MRTSLYARSLLRRHSSAALRIFKLKAYLARRSL